ncbi:hypothetical protein [Massilia sp. TS11]|uniref:hypothetical protein n=1 Tax=Massilia sp. TS11 TaxID=2908003 RepID=UPI001EDA6138|nr:hypothetical protein [Massilia sp. TS11]MCG2585616.1 hypothetical protein [Massilia sp. TS11]
MQFVIATLLLATAGLASASTAPSVNVSASRYVMKAHDFAAFKGTYELENGKTASVYMADGRYYVQVEGAPRMEIVAVDPSTFVSRDSKLKVAFDQSPNAVVASISLQYRGQ